jgi:putative NIF3 family GTP cyclohydrolase 1 type 2
VDTFKAGDPEAAVTGVATTGKATFDVLKRAAQARCNLVVTHEPTFYTHQDHTAAFATDATYRVKQAFIRERNMVVWRFHDHAHAIGPDPLVAGSARMLGWTEYASPSEPRIYLLPRTTLRDLARDVSRRLGGRAIRVAGDPAMSVTRVALGPGYGVPPLTAQFDVAVGGETSETGGNLEYIADAAAQGQPKGMIVLGHMLSEDWGMREVAEWLRPVVTGIPVEWIPAGEPFS